MWRKLAILVLPTTSWPEIEKHLPEVIGEDASMQPSEYRQMQWQESGCERMECMATMAIVRRNTFEDPGNSKPQDRVLGTVLPWRKYWGRHQRLAETAQQREPLYLVTVRKDKGKERLWLVAIYPSIAWNEAGQVFQSPKKNTCAIVDITSLIPQFHFDNGKGLRPTKGLLAQSLQTPRYLSAHDVALLNAAASDKVAQSSPESVESHSATDDSSEVFLEGTKTDVVQTRVERNPQARKACLHIHGYRCKVCDILFEDRYGAIGKDFIHVHHRNPMAGVKSTRPVDPEHDLEPVCPNCHAMLHRSDPPLSTNELRKRMDA